MGVLPQHEGLKVRAYVHDLYRHLAACYLAVVHRPVERDGVARAAGPIAGLL